MSFWDAVSASSFGRSFAQEDMKRHITLGFVTKALREANLLCNASQCPSCEKQVALCQVLGSLKNPSFPVQTGSRISRGRSGGGPSKEVER